MNTIANNTAAVLSELSAIIQNLNAPDFLYPISTTTPAYTASLGIRSLVKTTPQSVPAYSFQYVPITERRMTSNVQWCSFKKEPIIDDLQSLFSNCHVISFVDWSDIDGASDLWDGLRRDVIRPLQKKDFEFVFFLGYLTNKLTFEIDEILDIIGDFSSYGRVTLALNKGEADKLWMILNGYDANKSLPAILPPDPKERYLSIFNTMNINYLLINTADRTLSFTRQDRFELIDKIHNNIPIAKYVRNYFNAGYSLGLQLQFELRLCVALGLAVSGTYRETGTTPDRNALLLYIKKWMATWRPYP